MAVNVASRIAELLTLKNMTQKELAVAAGITESAISHYVKGDRVPRGVNLIKISNALDVTADYLLNLGEHDDKENDLRVAKTLIARNSEKMSMEEKMELMSILLGKN